MPVVVVFLLAILLDMVVAVGHHTDNRSELVLTPISVAFGLVLLIRVVIQKTQGIGQVVILPMVALFLVQLHHSGVLDFSRKSASNNSSM